MFIITNQNVWKTNWKPTEKKQLGPIVFFRIFLLITHEIDRFQPGISEVSMFISNDELGKPVNHRH